MDYFTERHGMRKPIEHTSTITIEMYDLLLNCCEKNYINLALYFPEMCLDGLGCCGMDYEKFYNNLLFEIPTLYKDQINKKIVKPKTVGYFKQADQYALLDFIEFLGQNCKNISYSQKDYHSFFGYYHLNLYETDNIFKTFLQEIGNIFSKTGLLYTLTLKKIIKRVIENSILSENMEKEIISIKESGTKELLEEAVNLFKQPNPNVNRVAVEKLWDAFERLKTYYVDLDKKDSATKIINDISGKKTEFVTLFNDEFRIRHHETDKFDMIDNRHYDYFFNRCLSLISLVIKYLD